MADQKPIALYSCTQAQLYSVCRAGWVSLDENIIDFSDHSSIYTPPLASARVLAIEVAEQLPDFQERNEPSETDFILLKEAHGPCLTQWKKLRSHIKHAFAESLHKPKIESAGYDHYAKAANLNWSETKSLMNSGKNFIDNNTPVLAAAGMPAAFTVTFNDARTAFIDLYDAFTDASQDQQEATDIKINANNAIYKDLMSMFEDGQLIYEKNPAKRDRFIFARVLAIVTTTSSNAGTTPADTIIIAGKVVEAITLIPISNASVNATVGGSTATFGVVTDSNGIYELPIRGLSPQPANSNSASITINAEALDHEPQSQELDYALGNRYELDFELEQAVEPAPTPESTEPEQP